MTPNRVLSIDWDYFIDAPIDFKASNFPDGGNENLPEYVLDAIWMSRYGQCAEIQKVKEDTSELVKLRILLKKIINKQNTRVVISDSHKSIYKYLEEQRQSKLPTEIYNIDFHHDAYDFGNEEVDCGNWFKKFIDSKNAHVLDKFMWVRREDSELSGEEMIDDNSSIGIPRDLYGTFQLVFLCRSGCWSPPHLDDKFLSLCRFLCKLHDKVDIVDDSILRSRYNKQFKSNVTEHRNIIKSIIGGEKVENTTK